MMPPNHNQLPQPNNVYCYKDSGNRNSEIRPLPEEVVRLLHGKPQWLELQRVISGEIPEARFETHDKVLHFVHFPGGTRNRGVVMHSVAQVHPGQDEVPKTPPAASLTQKNEEPQVVNRNSSMMLSIVAVIAFTIGWIIPPPQTFIGTSITEPQPPMRNHQTSIGSSQKNHLQKNSSNPSMKISNTPPLKPKIEAPVESITVESSPPTPLDHNPVALNPKSATSSTQPMPPSKLSAQPKPTTKSDAATLAQKKKTARPTGPPITNNDRPDSSQRNPKKKTDQQANKRQEKSRRDQSQSVEKNQNHRRRSQPNKEESTREKKASIGQPKYRVGVL